MSINTIPDEVSMIILELLVIHSDIYSYYPHTTLIQEVKDNLEEYGYVDVFELVERISSTGRDLEKLCLESDGYNVVSGWMETKVIIGKYDYV